MAPLKVSQGTWLRSTGIGKKRSMDKLLDEKEGKEGCNHGDVKFGS